MREDLSNPLFVKGHLRKISKKNSHWKMARLKGLFITQIIAIIEIVVLIIVMTAVLYENYIGHAGIFGWIAIKRERIYIMSFFLICLNGYMSNFFQIYYQHVIEKTRKRNYKDFFKTNIICTGNSKSVQYQILQYENLLENKRRMYEVQSYFDNFFRGITSHMYGSIGNIERNVIIAVDENLSENNTQILVQMYVKSLDKDDITMLNKYIHKEIRKAVKHNDLPLGKPYFTYIIYVEESTDIFQEIFCREVNDSPVCCLPVGMVLTEKKLYIPKTENSLCSEEFEKMKKRVYKILTEIPKKEDEWTNDDFGK